MWAEAIAYCNLCCRAVGVILDSRANAAGVRGDGELAPTFEKRRDNCGYSLEGLTIMILPSVFNFMILSSVLKKMKLLLTPPSQCR